MGHDPGEVLGQALRLLRKHRKYPFADPGGLPNEVLHAFSAAPIYQYLTSTEEPELDRLFASLVEAEARNWVMCCGTYPREDIEEVGLVEGHAYTIVTAARFSSARFRSLGGCSRLGILGGRGSGRAGLLIRTPNFGTPSRPQTRSIWATV